MNGSPSQVRLLVMVMVGWCALSAAPVVANSPALPAAFFVIAVGLVAAITLRFSTLAGLVMAVLGTALFAVSMVMDPATGAGRGGVQGVTGALGRLDQLVPALVAAVSLVGAAVCASLASWEIDGRPGAIQEGVRVAGAGDEAEELEERTSVIHGYREDEEARPYAGVAIAEPPQVRESAEAPSAEVPAAERAPAAEPTRETPAAPAQGAEAPAEQVPAERAAAEPPIEEPAAAEVQERAAGAEPAAAAESDRSAERGSSQEAASAERPAAEEAPAAAGGPSQDGGPASAQGQLAAEQTPKAEEPVPSPEPARAEEQAAALQVASEAQDERPEDAAVAAPAEGAPPAGEEKGKEEFAARDIQDRNGQTERDRPQAPDWRHRRRSDDDVARRLPRRRKR